jgi:hypothetical protein
MPAKHKPHPGSSADRNYSSDEQAGREQSLRDLADHDWLDERVGSDALACADESRVPIEL